MRHLECYDRSIQLERLAIHGNSFHEGLAKRRERGVSNPQMPFPRRKSYIYCYELAGNPRFDIGRRYPRVIETSQIFSTREGDAHQSRTPVFTTHQSRIPVFTART